MSSSRLVDVELDFCYFAYVDNGIIQKHATFPCPNFHFPVKQTVATVCNGIPECLRNLDEMDCRNETDEQIIVASLCLIFTIYWTVKKGFFFHPVYFEESRKPTRKTHSQNVRLLYLTRLGPCGFSVQKFQFFQWKNILFAYESCFILNLLVNIIVISDSFR